jgi:hypothetical protein
MMEHRSRRAVAPKKHYTKITVSDGKERIGLDLVLGIGRENLAGKVCSKNRLCTLDASGRNQALEVASKNLTVFTCVSFEGLKLCSVEMR